MRHTTTHHQRAAYQACTDGDLISARLHWLIAASLYAPRSKYGREVVDMVQDGTYTRLKYTK